MQINHVNEEQTGLRDDVKFLILAKCNLDFEALFDETGDQDEEGCKLCN